MPRLGLVRVGFKVTELTELKKPASQFRKLSRPCEKGQLCWKIEEFTAADSANVEALTVSPVGEPDQCQIEIHMELDVWKW